MPLDPPPRDANGIVLPHDHDGISNDDDVIRRISIYQTVTDKAGQRRISSMAFKASSNQNGGMSVDLKTLIIEAGVDPQTYVTTSQWIGSVYFQVGSLRDQDFQVGFHPLPDNCCHGEVWGNFTRSKQRQLQKLANWLVPIPNVSLYT